MGGHVDDAELDLSLPLVSISIGLSAVFLFGGQTREEAPTPIWLRSGDAIVVTGPARLCYHGVPRIVEGTCPEHLLDMSAYAPYKDPRELNTSIITEFIRSTRLNLNVRQVASSRVNFQTAMRTEAVATSSVLGSSSARRIDTEAPR